LTGTRLDDGFHGDPPAGAYWRDEDGTWSVKTPNGRIGSLRNHTVVEHEDRTITVTPSILVHDRPAHGDGQERPGWHGYLEQGVWRSV